MTATTARIRRISRDVEYAIASDATVLAGRSDARPNGRDDPVIKSMWSSTAHAQILLNERFNIMKNVRLHEAAESDTAFGISTSIGIAPVLPAVRMIDQSRALDRNMLIKAIAVDRNTDRNSIEAIG